MAVQAGLGSAHLDSEQFRSAPRTCPADLPQAEHAVDQPAAPRRKESRMSGMSRREFATLLGGAAAWPLGARAQQRTLPVIGFITTVSADGFEHRVLAFRQGLKQLDYVDGENVAIEYRWAENKL